MVSRTNRHDVEDYRRYDEGNHGFKVIVMSAKTNLVYWAANPSYEAALEETVNACKGAGFSRSCRLFAVGETTVWDLTEGEQEKAIAKYRAGRSPPVDTAYSNLLKGPGAKEVFEKYLDYEAGNGFKVFAMHPKGAIGYTARETYEAAEKRAMDNCKEYAKSWGCKLFAVGNTIVWEMSSAERDNAIKVYRGQ